MLFQNRNIREYALAMGYHTRLDLMVNLCWFTLFQYLIKLQIIPSSRRYSAIFPYRNITEYPLAMSIHGANSRKSILEG
jgi:hypothetical protein